MKTQPLNLPVIKKKPEVADLIAEEYDFIIASLNHGTTLIGMTDREAKRHYRIIKWLEWRRDNILKGKTNN